MIYSYKAIFYSIILMMIIFSSAMAADMSPWKELTFWRYKAISFEVTDGQIDLSSNKASSMLHRPITVSERKNSTLSWQWMVNQSTVKPTKLNLDSGDDRILGLYLFFTKEPRKADDDSLLHDGNYIAYIWGSNHAEGEIIKSKDGKGAFIILRSHDMLHMKWQIESRDYKTDFQNIFPSKGYPAFVAIAADTDDTNAKTTALIKDIFFN